MKFTFKTERPRGRYKSFDSVYHYIKLKGESIGLIENTELHRIRLQVVKEDINEDGNANCNWKWIVLKPTFNSVESAKDFVKFNNNKIIEKYKFPV